MANLASIGCFLEVYSIFECKIFYFCFLFVGFSKSISTLIVLADGSSPVEKDIDLQINDLRFKPPWYLDNVCENSTSRCCLD